MVSTLLRIPMRQFLATTITCCLLSTACSGADAISGYLPPASPADPIATTTISGTWLTTTGPGITNLRMVLTERSDHSISGTMNATRISCDCAVSGNLLPAHSWRSGPLVHIEFYVESYSIGVFEGRLEDSNRLRGSLAMEYDSNSVAELVPGEIILLR